MAVMNQATEQPTDPSLDPKRPYTMEAGWSARVMELVERMSWVETVSEKVAGWLQPVWRTELGARAKDFLHGRWLGHPLHPVLTDLPIGFWTSSVALDVMGASRSAGILSAAGSASAVATAASGLADWQDAYGRERRLGTIHGLLNLTGLAFHLASLGARISFQRRRARRLGIIGLGVNMAAAYFGGELIYARGVMVNRDAWTEGPTDWTPVLRDDDLREGQTRKVEAAGRPVLLYREAGLVMAMECTCPHAGGPLDEGEVSDGVVTCPWHGSRFRLRDGAVLRGPSTYPVPRLQARVRNGQVEVRGRQEA
jgi:nitrite reductase/ring-hydroxylating ferredoxin subunit/uncharacterized membrane protein